MKPLVRLAAFVAALVLVLAGAFYLAPLVRDTLFSPKPSRGAEGASSTSAGARSGGSGPRLGAVSDPDSEGPGASAGEWRDADLAARAVVPLSAVDRGYRLVSDTTSFTVGASAPFQFQIVGANGQPVRELGAGGEWDLNLVVVRLDGAGFQHLLPVRDMAGTWTTSLTLPSGGSYAAWVSFTAPDGGAVVLGSYLTVAGDFQPQPAPSPTPAAAVDGYQVELAGNPRLGSDSALALRVSRDGKPVTDLQSLGDTFAHLAVMRAGDLAYAFADASHQLDTGPDGAPLRFSVRFPTAGTYWLFVQFVRQGQSHTAAITMSVPAPAPSPAPTPASAPSPQPAHSGGT